MSEWRHDLLANRWVLIAPERAHRPNASRREPSCGPLTDDPFAEGAEDDTTPEVLAIRDPHSRPNQPGWQVRVITNKYPAVHPDDVAIPHDDGWFRRAPGGGVHEVIIECPQPETHLSRLPVGHLQRVLQAYRDRLATLRHEAKWRYAIVFKNHGPAAGATLGHAHSQLMALPFVPGVVTEELAVVRQHRDRTGQSFFADWLAREQAAGVRIVHESAGHVSLCPFASRFAYEICLLPKTPSPQFDALADADLADLAGHLRDVLHRLEQAADDPPYNFVLRTAPFHDADVEAFSWRLEILPRITRVAGYEWGTGWFINLMPPEVAAEQMRGAARDDE
jgi:UDPglucose--hexose-1-phosphate uridylyltransferase